MKYSFSAVTRELEKTS